MASFFSFFQIIIQNYATYGPNPVMGFLEIVLNNSYIRVDFNASYFSTDSIIEIVKNIFKSFFDLFKENESENKSENKSEDQSDNEYYKKMLLFLQQNLNEENPYEKPVYTYPPKESAHSYPQKESAHSYPQKESAHSYPQKESAHSYPQKESAHSYPPKEPAYYYPQNMPQNPQDVPQHPQDVPQHPQDVPQHIQDVPKNPQNISNIIKNRRVISKEITIGTLYSILPDLEFWDEYVKISSKADELREISEKLRSIFFYNNVNMPYALDNVIDMRKIMLYSTLKSNDARIEYIFKLINLAYKTNAYTSTVDLNSTLFSHDLITYKDKLYCNDYLKLHSDQSKFLTTNFLKFKLDIYGNNQSNQINVLYYNYYNFIAENLDSFLDNKKPLENELKKILRRYTLSISYAMFEIYSPYFSLIYDGFESHLEKDMELGGIKDRKIINTSHFLFELYLRTELFSKYANCCAVAFIESLNDRTIDAYNVMLQFVKLNKIGEILATDSENLKVIFANRQTVFTISETSDRFHYINLDYPVFGPKNDEFLKEKITPLLEIEFFSLAELIYVNEFLYSSKRLR
jgi:hypothetical protein